MASTTVVKTIGSTGVFSTLQLWEDGAPADLTTAEKSVAGTFLVAAFVQGEILSFVGSGAAGKFLDTDSTGVGTGTYVTYEITSGNPSASDVVIGATSGATCVLSSGTATNVGVIWQGQCQNQEFSGSGTLLTISGSTSSLTAYKELTTALGASFRDNANTQTNALRYNASNGCGITSSSTTLKTINSAETNARISKVQIANTGVNGGRALGDSAGTGVFFDYLILEGGFTATGSTDGVLRVITGGVACATTRNTLIIQRASAADHIVGVGSGNASFFNCTIAAPADLSTAPISIFQAGIGGANTVTNCSMWAGNSAKALVVTSGSTFSFTTCYSDISGTTGVTQTTYGNEFVNVNDATRDFRLSGGANQIDNGTTDSTNAANDIVGTARPNRNAYDVGCWEFVFTPTSISPNMVDLALTKSNPQLGIYLFPDSDISDGSWTDLSGGTNLSLSIDEEVLDDGDYIKSSLNPSNDLCEINLGNPSSTPTEPFGIFYRYRKSQVEQQIDLVVSLVQGTSVVATWTHSNISTSFVTVSQVLTSLQFAAISDFNDLRVRFTANKP